MGVVLVGAFMVMVVVMGLVVVWAVLVGVVVWTVSVHVSGTAAGVVARGVAAVGGIVGVMWRRAVTRVVRQARLALAGRQVSGQRVMRVAAGRGGIAVVGHGREVVRGKGRRVAALGGRGQAGERAGRVCGLCGPSSRMLGAARHSVHVARVGATVCRDRRQGGVVVLVAARRGQGRRQLRRVAGRKLAILHVGRAGHGAGGYRLHGKRRRERPRHALVARLALALAIHGQGQCQRLHCRHHAEPLQLDPHLGQPKQLLCP